MKTSFNKYIYAFFVLVSIYYIVQKDYGMAVVQLGIALVFDPFNPNQPWNERPIWQRGWLIFHLACVASLFGFMVGLGDR
jgi:hypothetical protein